MALIKSKPTSPGKRGELRVVHHNIHKGKPHAPLVEKLNKTGGRNNQGRITVRHIGGGVRSKYRIIDFKRCKDGIEATVERIEYDPNRTALIALVVYKDGERRYIIAPANLEKGQVLLSGDDAPISNGNCLPMKNIPVGTTIHCVEMKPGKGGQLARSAGTSVSLAGKDSGYAQVKLASGELRLVPLDCRATIGIVSNPDQKNINIGKAGRNRWLGKRPHVRGVAMNPIDHPHGGGEGKTSGGRHPVTPWGKPTKGKKTRKNKLTSKFILKRKTK